MTVAPPIRRVGPVCRRPLGIRVLGSMLVPQEAAAPAGRAVWAAVAVAADAAASTATPAIAATTPLDLITMRLPPSCRLRGVIDH
ncbi:protein of unknown function [Streptomyces murinus]